ncbi:MAG: hypothetical protein AAF415_04055 [Pseudomonadota bacterium]
MRDLQGNLPAIPVRDYRDGGLLQYALDWREDAHILMTTVLDGLGPAGRLLRPLLPIGDRIAKRRLRAMNDPYCDEILQIREALGVPGPVAFSLSYEFGCTARGFGETPAPSLFRTLDWPFRGLGKLVEIVRLGGPAGEWVTATWPGLAGVLHGAAPGRFAIALNQAPERRSTLGRGAAWLTAKLRFMRATGLPPPHLLRQVFETAPNYAAAKAMLAETPVAVPVIYTLIGPGGEGCTIERTENAAEVHPMPAAANHFTGSHPGRWRPRGYDSEGRHAAACLLSDTPEVDALSPPILNPLTRLSMVLCPDGALSIAGYEGERRVTEAVHFTPSA